MLDAIRRVEDLERQVAALPEEMPVFRDQRVAACPLDIRGNESIGGFEALRLILCAQFKGHDEVFVDDGETHDEINEFPEFLGGQVAADFFDDQAWDSQSMEG